ncbi:MAG: hypothetical protein RLY47_561 [Candidatus Parcubacteria bacterium]
MLSFHNTLTKKKEEFVPIIPGKVGFYSCGPTVYNYPHIGNYRAYIFADTLKRALMRNGFDVTHIMNITDVDDKTIRDSQKAGKTLQEFTEFYTEGFLKEIEELNIIPANEYPRATAYIDEMVDITEKLLEKGFAYRSDDGSIYYKIDQFKHYGQLVGLDQETLKENAAGRIKKDEYDKENPSDFALWKAWDETDGDVFWETRLGKGRPGWHIECSAMSMKNLGESFDVHTGGIDNIFPHHDNEIAQSEGCTGHQFVRYWLHNGWILVDGKKMSKSLGNFYTLQDLKNKGYYHLLAFRYLLLTSHYRSPLNFTFESLDAAYVAYDKLKTRLAELPDGGAINEEYKNRFDEALNDDLGTPQALAIVWEALKDTSLSDADKKTTILSFDDALGLKLDEVVTFEIPTEVSELAEKREAARLAKDWTTSDTLRKELQDLGFDVEDTASGPRIIKK